MTAFPEPSAAVPIPADPLHEFHLALGDREWSVLHAGAVAVSHADESNYLRDVREKRSGLPYGVALWPSAIALAHELAARGEEAFAGKTVLELGAGTGLPGIVAASLGAARVVQTDRDESALAVCRRNGKRNGATNIAHRLVDWTDWRDPARYDWIIGADILYAAPLHPYLERIFQTNLSPNGGRVLLGDPFRAVGLPLLESLDANGWNVALTKWRLGGADDGKDDPPRSVGVFELSPPA